MNSQGIEKPSIPKMHGAEGKEPTEEIRSSMGKGKKEKEKEPLWEGFRSVARSKEDFFPKCRSREREGKLTTTARGCSIEVARANAFSGNRGSQLESFRLGGRRREGLWWTPLIAKNRGEDTAHVNQGETRRLFEKEKHKKLDTIQKTRSSS